MTKKFSKTIPLLKFYHFLLFSPFHVIIPLIISKLWPCNSCSGKFYEISFVISYFCFKIIMFSTSIWHDNNCRRNWRSTIWHICFHNNDQWETLSAILWEWEYWFEQQRLCGFLSSWSFGINRLQPRKRPYCVLWGTKYVC